MFSEARVTANVDRAFVFKLIVIGDSGVGKTNMLLRLGDDTFDSTFMPSVGEHRVL